MHTLKASHRHERTPESCLTLSLSYASASASSILLIQRAITDTPNQKSEIRNQLYSFPFIARFRRTCTHACSNQPSITITTTSPPQDRIFQEIRYPSFSCAHKNMFNSETSIITSHHITPHKETSFFPSVPF